MKKKNIIMVVLLILVATMTIAFAAFSSALIINGTTSQSGTYGVVITGCTTEVVKIGIEGGKTPTATCTPTGTATSEEASCNAQFMQPGDIVRCNFNIKNTGNLKVKPNGTMSCVTGNAGGSLTLYYPAGGYVSSMNAAKEPHIEYYVDPNGGNDIGLATGNPGGGNVTTNPGGGNVTTNLPRSNATTNFPNGYAVTDISAPIGGGLTVTEPPIGTAITGGGWKGFAGGTNFLGGFTFTWNRNRLAPNATLINEFSITLVAPDDLEDASSWNEELSSIDLLCSLPYGQDI